MTQITSAEDCRTPSLTARTLTTPSGSNGSSPKKSKHSVLLRGSGIQNGGHFSGGSSVANGNGETEVLVADGDNNGRHGILTDTPPPAYSQLLQNGRTNLNRNGKYVQIATTES